MSERRASATQHLRRNMLILVLALCTPLLISFLLYLAGSAFGFGTLPTVGYGITAACTANGVSYIWCQPAGSTLPNGPGLPTGVINLFNDVLLIVVLIVILIQAYRIVGAFLEGAED